MFASSGYLEVLYFQRPVGKPRVAEQVTQRNQAKYRAIRVWLHPARRFQAINQQPHTPLPEKRTGKQQQVKRRHRAPRLMRRYGQAQRGLSQ